MSAILVKSFEAGVARSRKFLCAVERLDWSLVKTSDAERGEEQKHQYIITGRQSLQNGPILGNGFAYHIRVTPSCGVHLSRVDVAS